MRLYTCQFCSLTLYFENTHCVRRRGVLGYWAETDTLAVLDPIAGTEGTFTAWAVPLRRLRGCANNRCDVCNWMVDADDPDTFCIACRYNRVVPDHDSEVGRIGWRKPSMLACVSDAIAVLSGRKA